MIYAFRAISSFLCKDFGRKSQDDSNQAFLFLLPCLACSEMFWRLASRNDIWICFFLSLEAREWVGDFGKSSEKTENERHYQAVFKNCFNNNIPLFNDVIIALLFIHIFIS